MDEISSIKTFFDSHNVHLSIAWLEGCVNWCKEENLPANYTLKDLQHKIFEQWLLLDLRDVEIPSLPPNLSNETKYTLNGNYTLQVMKIIDISKPKHWQLHKIRNSGYKNSEIEIESSKRVLQVTFTDGVQEVEAMEFKPISSLNLNLSPGLKIRLMGPIIIRRGRLMLEEKHIKILGGEVDELIVPNAAENVLAAILKLPINPTPNVIEESLLTANKDIFDAEGQTRPAIQNKNTTIRNNELNSSSTISNRNVRDNLHAASSSISHNKNSVRNNIANPSTVTSTSSRDNLLAGIPSTSYADPFSLIKQNRRQPIDANEELMIAAEMMEIDEHFEEPSSKRRKSNKTPDLFDDIDIDDSVFANIEVPSTKIKTTPDSNKMPPPVTAIKNSSHMKISNGTSKMQSNMQHSELENDLFENFDVGTHLEHVMNESNWRPQIVPPIQQKPQVMTIEKLLKNIPNISNGKFKIKAKFTSIVEKLTVAEEEYYMVVKVVDETQELIVRIHSDIISELTGYYPVALMSLKQAILENNMEAKAKVLGALKNVKETLEKLDNIMEVQVNVKEKFPVVIKILD